MLSPQMQSTNLFLETQNAFKGDTEQTSDPNLKLLKRHSYFRNSSFSQIQQTPIQQKPQSQNGQLEEDSQAENYHSNNNNHSHSNGEISAHILQKQFGFRPNQQDDFNDKDSELIRQQFHRPKQIKRNQVTSDNLSSNNNLNEKNPNTGRQKASSLNYFRDQIYQAQSRVNKRNETRSTQKDSFIEKLQEDLRYSRRPDLKNIQSLLGIPSIEREGTQKSSVQRSNWLFIGVFEKVKLFVEKMKSLSTFTHGFSSINNKHLELIDDLSDVRQQQSIQNTIGACLVTTIRKIPILSPDSTSVICWNFLLSFCILIQFVMIPLKICFELEFETILIEMLFYYIPAVIFVMEIFVRLNISYYYEGILIDDRSKITQYYLFKTYYFWVDLITTLSFLLSKDLNHPILIFVVIFRFLQFIQLIKEIDEHFQISQRFSTGWNLTSLFLIILLLAHFTGCGFHYIAYIQQSSNNSTWLSVAKISNADWYVRFLYSFYWSSITMITVGYGDIVPITPAEKIYVIVMTLISAGVFAYSVNTIGSIFTEYSKKQEALKAQKHDISIYMRTRGISGLIQIETLKYLDYVNQEEMEATKRGQGVISLLSDQIQEKLQADYYGRILKASSLFSNYSPQFLTEVAQIMKERVYGPGELIFYQGDLDNRLFFIVKGQLQIFLSRNKKGSPIIISTLESGEVGHNGFFADQPRATSLKSLNVSHTLIISKEDILPILLKFPQDLVKRVNISSSFNSIFTCKERFCLIKDSMQQNLQKQKFNCFACGTSGHNIITCSRIHFKKSKWFSILKHNYSKDQERQKYERTKEKCNCYKTHQDVRLSLIKLRGKMLAEVSGVQFDNEGQNWLMQQKDKIIFTLLPSLVYQNNKFILLSDTSNHSDDTSNSLLDESDGCLSEQPSLLECSQADIKKKDQIKDHSPPHQFLNKKDFLQCLSPNMNKNRKALSKEKVPISTFKYSTFKQLAEHPSINNSDETSSIEKKESSISEPDKEQHSLKIMPFTVSPQKSMNSQNKKQVISNRSLHINTKINQNTAASGSKLYSNEQHTTNAADFDEFQIGGNNFLININQFDSEQKQVDHNNSNNSLSQSFDGGYSINTLNSHFLAYEESDQKSNFKNICPESALDIPSPLLIIYSNQKQQDANKNEDQTIDHPLTSSQNLKIPSIKKPSLFKSNSKQKSYLAKKEDNFDKTDHSFSSAVIALTQENQEEEKEERKEEGKENDSQPIPQKLGRLKTNSGSFKSILQKRQEQQKELKKQCLLRQDSYLSVNPTSRGGKKKSILKYFESNEIPLFQYKSKLDMPKTPLSINRLNNFQNHNNHKIAMDFDRSSMTSSLHKQIYSPQNSLNFSPHHKFPLKDFHHALSQQIQQSQLNRQQSQQTPSNKSSQYQAHSGEAQIISNCSQNQIFFAQNAEKIEEVQPIQQDEFFNLDGLDCLKNYEIYFPECNCAQVLKSYGYIRLKKISELSKKGRRRYLKKNSYISGTSIQNKKFSKFKRQLSFKVTKHSRISTIQAEENPIKQSIYGNSFKQTK